MILRLTPVIVLTAIILFPVLTGCSSLLKQPPAVITYYQPEYPAPAGRDNAFSAVLMIRPLNIQAPYDRNSIVYRQHNGVCGFYAYDQWISNPADLVSANLVRDFQYANLFEAVVIPGMFRVPDYELNGTIVQIGEVRDPGTGESTGSVHMNMVLIGPRTATGQGTIRFQKDYTASRPCQAGDQESIVQAISASLQAVSSNIIADVRESLLDT